MTANQLPSADDELLSAYLDDQLGVDERARVEALLASNPVAQLLLDELTAQRAALRQMPRETLSVDFAQRVLRRAEREVLVPSSATAAAQQTSANGEPSLQPARADDSPSWIRWPQGRRPWIYAGLAAAAALVMMFSDKPAEQDRNEVAALPVKLEMSAPSRDADHKPLNTDRAAASAPATSAPATPAMPPQEGATSLAVPSTPAAAVPATPPAATVASAGANATGAPANAAEPLSESQWLRTSLEPLGLEQFADQVLQQAAEVAGQEQRQFANASPQLTIIRCDVNRNTVEPEKFAAWFLQSAIVVSDNQALAAKAATLPGKPTTSSGKPVAAQPSIHSATIDAVVNSPIAAPDPDNVAIAVPAETPAAKPATPSAGAKGAAAASAPQAAGTAATRSIAQLANDNNLMFFCVASPDQVSATVDLLRNQSKSVSNLQVIAPAGQQSQLASQISAGAASDARNENGARVENKKSAATQQNASQAYARRIIIPDEKNAADEKNPITRKNQADGLASLGQANRARGVQAATGDAADKQLRNAGQPLNEQQRGGESAKQNLGADNVATMERVLFVFRLTPAEAAPTGPAAPAGEAKPAK